MHSRCQHPAMNCPRKNSLHRLCPQCTVTNQSCARQPVSCKAHTSHHFVTSPGKRHECSACVYLDGGPASLEQAAETLCAESRLDHSAPEGRHLLRPVSRLDVLHPSRQVRNALTQQTEGRPTCELQQARSKQGAKHICTLLQPHLYSDNSLSVLPR